MANVESIENPLRIAAVDDDQNIHLFLKDVLQPSKVFVLVGTFSNAAQALSELPRLRPNLTLMDIRLPDMNGIECVKRLKEFIPHFKVVIVTGTHEASWASTSRAIGAVAYLVKPFDGEQLLATLSFASGDQFDTESRFRRNKSEADRANPIEINRLNQKEREVLKNLADGLLYKEIADILGISYASVHKCQHKIFRKLHVSNRSEAIRAWLESGGR